MVWKLFDKEERPKIQTLHQIACLFCVCDRPDALEHNKEFCMGKHEGLSHSFLVAWAG